MFDFIFNISFEYPYIFLVLVIFIICGRFCKAKLETYYMPHLDIYSDIVSLKSGIVGVLKWTAIIFAIISLASPIKELNVINTKKDGIDIVLSLDTSGSMRQIGFNKSNIEQNRWEVVKDIVKDFILKRVNDNIALVVFGSSVMTASPLSYDKNAQQKILQGLDIAVVGEKTALIDSIATSINILKNKETKTKIIIALTDGDDTSSNIPISVVEKLAKKYNIKIYSIAIATPNTYLLDKLSQSSGGKTFKALNSDDLVKIYETINSLEKSKIDQNRVVLKEYYYFYPLFISFLALLFFVYLQNKRGV